MVVCAISVLDGVHIERDTRLDRKYGSFFSEGKAMLDEVHIPLPQPKSDHNIYTLGRVSSYNV
jgi:hypothetical protein